MKSLEAIASALDDAPRPRLRGWLTVRELTDEFRFSSTDACRHFLRRHRIVGIRRGRKLLIDRQEFLAQCARG